MTRLLTLAFACAIACGGTDDFPPPPPPAAPALAPVHADPPRAGPTLLCALVAGELRCAVLR